MGGHSHASSFPDGRDDFRSRLPLHEGEGCSQAEQVTVRRGHFDSWNDEKAIHRLPVRADHSGAGEVLDCIAGVVVGKGNSAQAASFCRLNHRFGGVARIRGIVGVQVQVEGVSHPESLGCGLLSGFGLVGNLCSPGAC